MLIAHIKTLLWLKIRIWRNTLRKGKTLSTILTVLMVSGALVVAAGLSIGAFFGGLCMSPKSIVLVSILDGVLLFFLFIWITGIMAELQRSEVIDFRKMLHLPVSLKLVFLLNYAVSLVSPLAFCFFVSATTFTIGLCLNFGAHMILAWLVAMAFLMMLSAWTYFFRGWLAILLENKRRRRAVVAIATICLVLVPQLPNLLNIFVFRSFRSKKDHVQAVQTEAGKALPVKSGKMAPQQLERTVTLVNKVIPLGWFPMGIQSLVDKKYHFALLYTCGLLVLGIIPLSIGYRSTVNFYLGKVRRAKTRTKKKAEPSATGRGILSWRLPLVAEDTGAIALVGLTNYLRNPLFRLQFIMPVIGVLIMMGVLLREQNPVFQGILPFAVIYFPFMSFSSFIFNIFGIDRQAFSTYVMMPVERRKVLVGKNIALIIPLLVYLVLAYGIGALLLRGSTTLLIIGVIQFVQIYLLLAIAGNLISILFPRPIRSDVMRRQGAGAMRITEGLLAMALFTVAVLPSLFCLLVDSALTRLFDFHLFSVGIILSILQLPVVLLVYIKSTGYLGQLLMKRETVILEKLMQVEE